MNATFFIHWISPEIFLDWNDFKIISRKSQILLFCLECWKLEIIQYLCKMGKHAQLRASYCFPLVNDAVSIFHYLNSPNKSYKICCWKIEKSFILLIFEECFSFFHSINKQGKAYSNKDFFNLLFSSKLIKNDGEKGLEIQSSFVKNLKDNLCHCKLT